MAAGGLYKRLRDGDGGRRGVLDSLHGAPVAPSYFDLSSAKVARRAV